MDVGFEDKNHTQQRKNEVTNNNTYIQLDNLQTFSVQIA